MESKTEILRKTNLRRNARISLSAEDLIHPHEASELPGYLGYTPQLKYNCGHTYGYHTDKLTKKLTRNEKLNNTRPADGTKGALDGTDVKFHFLPAAEGDRKLVEKMVPGYTGFVPQHRFTYGSTYKEGTEDAITKIKRDLHMYDNKQADLVRKTRSLPKLNVHPDFPQPDPTHPGLSVNRAFSYPAKHFSDRRSFTEAPIPGYSGYVPHHENHKLGGRFGQWTKNAYTSSLYDRLNQEKLLTQNIQTKRHAPSFTWPHNQSEMGGDDLPGGDDIDERHGQVYNKRLGMVPKYVGYIPQGRFDFGATYGDSTRRLPVCSDTGGYAAGRYMSTGPPVERTVIPVRQ